MLTLSDELVATIDSAISTQLTYSVYIKDRNSNEETHIYEGSVYGGVGPVPKIYYKDIIEPYVRDSSWITKTGFTKGYTEFQVIFKTEVNEIFESPAIENRTVIPTVDLKTIPALVPRYAPNFIWGYKIDNYPIASSENENDIIQTNKDGNGHYMFAGTPEYPLYRLVNSKAEKIMDFDPCDSRFYLIWITRDNDYMCRPFCKKNTLNESVSTNYIYTVSGDKNPYNKSSKFKWTLNSDWLTYDEHNVYESLLVSPVVFLYDNELNQRYKVNVTNSDWTEKNSKNNKKPFNMTVTVEMAKENSFIY